MINVIGLGYIGLPTALMLAAHGEKVVGTDCKKAVVDTLTEGKTTFKEKGLDELFGDAKKHGIVFSTEYQVADIYIISVPTPYEKESRKVDPGFVVSAARSVMAVAPAGATVIVESTVSPGTMDEYVRPLLKEIKRTDIHLAHAPERIIPGNMLFELLHNNRTIGADDEETGERVKAIYATFCQGEIVVTDIKTAEMTKVVENTFRAVNIAFANELARICRQDHLDVYEIIRICNMHPRVNILQPGPGVGGHCIPVDPWFLVGAYPGWTGLIEEALTINDSQPGYILKRIHEIMDEKGFYDTSRVGIYGLTYKENVDDLRESPSLHLLKEQPDPVNGFKVYDPYILKDVADNQFHNLDEFLDAVDMVVIMVKHNEIKENADKLSGKIVLDCQNAVALPEAYHI